MVVAEMGIALIFVGSCIAAVGYVIVKSMQKADTIARERRVAQDRWQAECEERFHARHVAGQGHD